MFIAPLFIIAKNWNKQPKRPSKVKEVNCGKSA